MKNLITIAARNGAIAGALLVLLMVTLFYLGRHPLLIAPFLDFRIIVFGVFMFFSLKEFRDYYQNGELYFWQGLIGSGVLVFTAATVSAVGLYIFGSLENDFVSQYITQFIEYFQSFPKEEMEALGKDQFERNLQGVRSTNSAQLAQDYFGKGLIIGLPVSIIMSTVLRKQPNP
jgi:hypothetical protein